MAPKLIVGLMGSSVAGSSAPLLSPGPLTSFLSLCTAHNVTELDTARVYASGGSESAAGAVNACSRFCVSTKAPAFSPNSLSYDNIINNCHASLKALQTSKVDIYYLHGPDRATPLEEQCRAIGDLYKEGCFKRFGVSNISPDEVRQIHNICAANEGYPLPSIYQGGYNATARGAEEGLFPLLKELGMGFYAFSPLAGGLLAKEIQEVRNPKEGSRYEKMKNFGDLYLKDEIVRELEKVRNVCEASSLKMIEAALRWLRWHSPLAEEGWNGDGLGNGVIIGASSEKQLGESFKAWEGHRLPESVVKAFEDMNTSLRGLLPYHG